VQINCNKQVIVHFKYIHLPAFRVPLKKRLTNWIKINVPLFKKKKEKKERNNEIIITSLVSYHFLNFLSCYQYTRWIHSTVKINWPVDLGAFMFSRSVKCVTRTTKIDNSVLPEPEIFSFITRFLLENGVFFHLKRINHNNFY
jgi:hypothetical protein